MLTVLLKRDFISIMSLWLIILFKISIWSVIIRGRTLNFIPRLLCTHKILFSLTPVIYSRWLSRQFVHISIRPYNIMEIIIFHWLTNNSNTILMSYCDEIILWVKQVVSTTDRNVSHRMFIMNAIDFWMN